MSNIWEPGQPEKNNNPNDESGNKVPASFKIVGFNLLALAAYTCISAITSGGILLDAAFLFFHVITCLIVSIGNRSWAWLLSALAVLLIGVSTCVDILGRMQ